MKKIIKYFIHSNLYISIAALSLAFVCEVLLNINLLWEPLFISFASTFFIYNINRITDKKEDIINYPERSEFVSKFGKMLLVIGFIIYFISIFLSALNSFNTLVISLIPFVLIVFYGILRVKKILYIK